MKYITRKVIRGKAYYYLQYKTYNKSLGEFLPTNLAEKLEEFFEIIGEKEYELLPKKVKNNFKYGSLAELEALHYFQLVLKHDLCKKLHHETYKKLTLLFTYHSNRSEGSKTTKQDVIDFKESNIRKPKTKTQRELFNSFMALNHALSKEMKWNLKNIKYIHGLLLDGLDPSIAGQWKNENNTVGFNHSTTESKKVPEKMKALMNWLKKEFNNKAFYPPELALKFYCRFEQIHPFMDGNGRVGRILLNAILYKSNYPPVIFFSENHKEHCNAIEQALNGRWEKLYKHFLKQVKKTHAELLT